MWKESLDKIRTLAKDLLADDYVPPAVPDEIWAQSEGSTFIRQVFVSRIAQMQPAYRLAHEICKDISDLRMIDKRRFEEWEFALVDRLLLIFHWEWTHLARDEQEFPGDLRCSVSDLLVYFDIWSPREFGKLSCTSHELLHNLDRVLHERPTAFEFDRGIMNASLQSALSKLRTGSLMYRKVLGEDCVRSLLDRLRHARDNATAASALFEIGALCQRSDGRATLLHAGLAKDISDFLLKYSKDPWRFEPKDVPINLIISNTAEMPLTPTALRKVLPRRASRNSPP
jgi:hypothetical protein